MSKIDKVLNAVYYSDIDKLTVFSKREPVSLITYKTLVNGKLSASYDDCLEIEEKYYYLSCANALVAYYANRLEYKKSHEVLSEIFENDFFLKLERRWQTQLTYQIKLLSIASQQSFEPMNNLILNGFYMRAKLDGTEKSFLVDTGAKFSATKFFEDGLSDLHVMSATGKKGLASAKVIDFLHVKNLLFLKSERNNMLGLNFLKTYKRIIFKSYKPKTQIVKRLYQDSSNIFVVGHMNVKGNNYSKLNICLDTGASATVIMPKGYKKIREHLVRTPPKILNFNGFFGQNRVLGRIVGNLSVGIGDLSIDLINVPAIFKSRSSTDCDVLVGRTILQEYLYEIDWEDKTVTFSGH